MIDYYAELSVLQADLVRAGHEAWATDLELALRSSATSSEAFVMTGGVLRELVNAATVGPDLKAKAEGLLDLATALFEGRDPADR
jgi:hypothetical protein